VKANEIYTVLLKEGRELRIKDTVNERTNYRKKLLGNLPPNFALLSTLESFDSDDNEKQSFLFEYTQDEMCRLEHFFFAHPDSIELFKSNYDGILMNCTYKTNRFGMSFLYITWVTCTSNNFEIAYCFVPVENVPTYNWAIMQFHELCKYMRSSRGFYARIKSLR
jgi:hypothetical protein